MLSPKVKHFIFKNLSSPDFKYLPGHFITIHLEQNDKIIRRSYSIANALQQNNRIEFAAGYVANGPGTNLLFNLKPKDTINITGPFGRLTLKDDLPKRYILVATSTGVTPYRSMMDELKKRSAAHPDLKVVILQGVQKKEDILYKEEFEALTRQFPNISFRAHLSREAKENLGSNEFAGYVQSAFPELSLNPEQDMVYLCGNPGMIDESFNYLKENGFTTQQIIREKYISS
jgi:NAD(P)H-flavin reductase